MRSKLLILLLAVVGLAALGWLIRVGQQQQQSQEEVARLRAELASMKASMREQPDPRDLAASENPALKNTLTPLQKMAVMRREARSPTEAPGLVSEPESEGALREVNRPPPLTYEQSQAAVFTAYAREVPDSTWSRDAERKLDSLIRPRLPNGLHLSSIECRNTMCQVEVLHRDPRVAGTFIMEGFRGWPGSLFVAGEKEARGEFLVTIIAAREGTELPLGPR